MFSEKDIEDAVGRSALAAGAAYVRQGLVRHVGTVDGIIFDAQVQGSQRRPYHQSIAVTRQKDGSYGITGECSCYLGGGCKHVAAALLSHLRTRVASPQPTASGVTEPVSAPLPAEVAAWLRDVAAAQAPETDEYPPGVRRRLLYVFRVFTSSDELDLVLQSAELARDGTLTSTGSSYSPAQLLSGSSALKFVRPSDRAIIRQLMAFPPRSPEFLANLPAILATGRARWQTWHGPVMTAGPAVQAALAWKVAGTLRQRMALGLPPPLLPLLLSEPCYIDPSKGLIGRVETGVPARLARTMLTGPPVHPALAERIGAELAVHSGPAAPAPIPVGTPERLKAKLQPVLDLMLGSLPFDPVKAAAGQRIWYATGPHSAPVARLSWRYGPFTLAINDTAKVAMHEGRLIELVHDARAERKALAMLAATRLVAVGKVLHTPRRYVGDYALLESGSEAWIRVMLETVPALRDAGWDVRVADDFPYRVASLDGEVSFDLRDPRAARVGEGSGIDWLELHLGVVVDGERIDLAPALAAVLAGGRPERGRDLLVTLADGRVLPIPFARIEPILQPLLDLFGSRPEGGLRVSRLDAAGIAALEAASTAAGIPWSGGDAIRDLGRQLRDHGGLPPAALPAGFAATLRPYQAQGLAWLQFLRTAGLGGVLADDMGLGKTVQALAHLAIEQAEGRLSTPALVVCPTSLVGNWRAEAARFAPRLRTLVLHGPERAALFDAIPAHDLVITTYPLLARDHESLAVQAWHIVILDEAQTIKNPLATTSRLARTLKAGQRLCLSGTPLENHLGELWSLFDFMLPGFLGDSRSFTKRWRTPIEKGGDAQKQAMLARMVAPFLLRRTKGAVASDLPPKTEIPETIEMGEAQRGVYESIRLAMHVRVQEAVAERGMARSGIVILDALLKMRQACCDPRLLKLPGVKTAKAGSAKLERLMEMLPQMLEEGRRILLFSQFTSMLALIQAELEQASLPYVLLTGDTKDRATPIARFQKSEVPLFLISLKAGGVGLNLTAADTVIHYDPWWNPAVEDQATDRAHRIGQDKPVFVHRLITLGTIEEKMEVLKSRKAALASGILGGAGEGALALTEGDLEALFAPG